ncbi:CBR-EPC-1 protein [Loa loa]|uniref:Enhancer of polycomb-like protein n=1 Tax=Loa loa TaxID=7209 RepID=A0A1S0UF14_LOALO|nr:CBR-EPC-1 protein [Loa loa]EJD74260.1 CBR-EPC-1 protein [Loa loa]
MATTSKLSFRARNLDATKSMPVYCADELPDLAECTPINRAVAQMPTGMEKDEENESHLQEAILAQQASTSGIAVENHVIPTPKVFTVDRGYYDALYPVQPAPSINQLIKVQASLSLGNEEPDYDIDSEDEAWLAERGGLTAASDFEKMMELLEGASSGLQICQPNEARSLLKDFETDLVDDVYDYWLQKRKDAAASRKIASLIPRVKTDARRDASGSDIAYVAFRRRLERMQTRKNRKNDEDSYEKILKLGHDLSRVVVLFDMLRRREHTKQTVIGLDDKICKCRWAVSDFNCVLYNHILSKVKLERNTTMSPTEESQDELLSSMSPTKSKAQKRKRHSRTSTSEADKDLVSRTWLRRNAELWNKPATAANVLNAGASPSTVSTADAERNAEAALDGRYTFKRRRGCRYRSSLFSNPPEVPKVSPAERFYRTFMPSANGVRCIGYARRRMGRGGRIIFDRLLLSAPSTSQSAPDPPFCSVIDTTKSYQCKLTAVDGSKDDNDSSDSDDSHKNWDDEDEREYRRREELYAKRIFDMSDTGSTQKLQSGLSRDGTSLRGTGEQVVVLGEDNNGSASGIGQNIMSVNGVRETDRLRVVNLQQNGPPLNVSARSVGDCGLQPVLLTASVGGKVEKVAPLPNASSVSYQQKRVHDHSLRASSQISLSSETSESSPVFYTHLPPPLPATTRLLAAGEQAIHRPPRTFEFINSSGMLNQAQTLIVTTTQPPRQDHLERQILAIPSQEVIIGGQSIRPRTGGRRRSFASSVAQLSSLPRPEINLQRSNTCGFNADIVTQATHCVDTKRLELAIKGSGARIKPSPMIAHSLLQSCPPETKTLRDLLLGTGLSNTKTALSNTAVMPAVTRTYTAPQYVPVVGDAHRYVPFTNVVTTTSYYMPVTDVSSPGSESMSPPTPHAMSPAVQNQSARNYFGVTEPKIQTPVAVVSSRPSLNGTQVDTRRSGGAISKTNGGSRERETFISSPQVGIELQPHQAKCRVGSASSPLNAVLATEKPAEGNAVSRSGGNSAAATATTPAVVAEEMYAEPAGAGEDTLSNKVTNNHRDIAACHGMVNYVIN